MTEINLENPIKVHPWRRYFARILDCTLLSLLFFINLGFFFPSSMDTLIFIGGNPILDLMASGFVVMFLNSFLISFLGATPGKYIFGIQVRDEHSQELSLFTALKREFLVYIKGLALCFPIASILTLIAGYSRLKKKGETSWDKQLKCKIVYRPNNLKQIILNIIGVALYVLLLVMMYMVNKHAT